MAAPAPKIDQRSAQEVAAQLERLAQLYSAWRPAAGQPDAGAALIRIAARMAEVLINRLNQLPDKNFLAFLDLIGARVAPPQPARVPLTFQLAPGAGDALAPAGTQVAAAPAPGEAEVIFETEQDLVVTSAQLVAAFVRQPEAGRYGDYTARAIGADNRPFPAFGGDATVDQPIEHALYLAHDDIFTLPGPKTITLDFHSPDVDRLLGLALSWSCWDGTAWAPIAAEASTFPVTLHDPPRPEPLAIGGRTARWLRAQVHTSLSLGSIPTESLPRMWGVTIAVTRADARLLPDQGFAKSAPLDLGDDFLPFGERPRPGDTLNLLSQELFARQGAVVTLHVTVSPASHASTTGQPRIRWEMWDGSAWRALAGGDQQFLAHDTTAQLTATGEVTFTVPPWARACAVGGVPGHWLRARLAAGNYGTEPRYELLRDGQGLPRTEGDAPLYRFVQGGFAPPIIQSLRLSCTYADPRPPTACLTANDFRLDDVTDRLAAGSAITPFTPTVDTRPALYLGFDRPFASRPTLLYAQVEPQPYDERLAQGSQGAPPQVVWEYAAPPEQPGAPCAWKRLGARDETRAFAERGLIAFVGPYDLVEHAEFGRAHYWLRARWASGAFPAPPRLRRILTNTVWASQAATAHDEVLGSSDGSPGQVLRTSRAPVLPGQQIEVREPELPAADERARLAALEGASALTPVVGAAGQVWVRWHETPDFHASGPRDRHYVFDHLAGAVRFGDGHRGMIPPQGRGNIRAARYRTGGGAAGNRPAGAIAQLKAALPAIAGVTNLEAASGGADQEPLERVQAHGPLRLRHGDRTVAAQDYEDLAREASPEVARALGITPRFNPLDLGQEHWGDPAGALADVRGRTGAVTLVLVPRSDDPQPIPSLELMRRVEAFILARCPPTAALRIAGPAWLTVTVTAEVAPAALDSADALAAAVAAALRRFLHPLTGGADGRGWAFGRRPHDSDIYAVIESVPGVDHVRALLVNDVSDQGGGRRFHELTDEQRARLLVSSGSHVIRIVPREGA